MRIAVAGRTGQLFTALAERRPLREIVALGR